MLKLRFLFFLIIVFISTLLYSQPYGNEWINHSQKYIKIKILEQGLYGISVTDAIQAGLISQDVNPGGFQLFNKGKEIPILITGSDDNLFNGNDKIIFYGEPNDASLDIPLYSNVNDLPNEEVSLFENENFYFLTYNASLNGKRYHQLSPSSSNLIPEDFIIARSRLNFLDTYYPGEYILEGMSLSEYIEGEGYLGTLLSIGNSVNYNLNTNNYLSTSGFQPQLSFYVAGRSNALSTAPGGNNHHLRVVISSSTVFDTVYRGYKTIRKNIPITLSAENTSVTLSSVNDLGAQTDFQAPGYLEIKYPRNLNLNNSIKELNFSIDNSKINSFLSFSNSNIAQPILLDLTSGTYSNGINISNNLQFVVNNNQVLKNYFLGDLTQLKTPLSLENISFRNFSPDDMKSFLIISNKTLQSGVESYLNYNNTIRNLPSAVAYVEDLYNEFYFGFHHPLALRNFCKWALDKASTKPEYLLLLGKGYEIPKHNLSLNLVPTYGYPASDNLLTSGINSSTLEPALATGRIPAKTNTDIENYLKKLQVYENLPSELWRKKLVHITGGKTVSESSSFKNYMNNLYNIAKGEYYGAYVKNFNKTVSDAVTENLTDNIIRETRDGAGLISFLGHGSSTGTEVSLGLSSQTNNADKPTIYIINGCSTGNSFTQTNSYGEQFVLQKDQGAVGWIGTTSEGVASYLYGFTSNFYQNWFLTNYGKSISSGIKNGIKSYGSNTDRLNLAHARQYIFLGDPYLKFTSSEKPDFLLPSNGIYLTSFGQNASQEQLKISFIINNPKKSLNSNLEVNVTRTLPNNTKDSKSFNVNPIYNKDTIHTEFANTGLNVIGTNKITITLDPNNRFQEDNKLNNVYEYSFFLVGNGVNPIYPIKNSIISSEVVLEAQPDNLFTTNTNYTFEIDTVPSFNSSFLLSSGNINTDNLPRWKPNIQFENNKVYFWRVKIDDPNAPQEVWSSSYFTYSSDILYGQSISQRKQIEDSNFTLKNIIFNNSKFDFVKDLFATTISTRGDDVPTNGMERRIRVNPNDAVAWTDATGIAFVAFHSKEKGKVFSYPSIYNSQNGPNLQDGYTGQFIWNTNIPAEIDSMVNYINQIPDGYFVMGLNNQDFAPKELPNNAKQALKSLGLIKFEEVNRGEPYLFWGIKGSTEGSALEYTADRSSNTSPREQYFRYYHDLEYKVDNGTITTDKIGPAVSWKSAEISINSRPTDALTFSIIGINRNNTEVALTSFNNILPNQISDLSSIDANDYPYLKIKAHIQNSHLRNIPTINHWRVVYEPLTELTFNPIYKNNFHSDILHIGDSLKLDLGLTNLSKTQSSNIIKLNYKIIKQDNSTISKSLALPPLDFLQSTEFKIEESTIGLAGKNNLTITLENMIDGDNYDFNNNISYDFTVEDDKKEPNIDILFDGKRIVNGEIVSATPIIDIASIDENAFLLQKDTSLLDIYLRKENENMFKRINFSDNRLHIIETGSSTNNRIVVRYSPDRLENGLFTLKVSSKDVLNNSSKKEFSTDFEVINESTISNFYPYPNPVINSMRFVFTLTGSKIPNKLKIQILNQSGKVVREILKEELGNLRIGNNISDFVWDCKDQFGDRLANGVYFYKVYIEDESENFKHRFTKGDSNFKNNIGKIYLIK